MKWKFYIHHYTPLVERARYLDLIFETCILHRPNTMRTWMNMFDNDKIESLHGPILKSAYRPELKEQRIFKLGCNASPQEQSLSLSHIAAIHDMLFYSRYLVKTEVTEETATCFVSFEDDVVINSPDTFIDDLERVVRQAPNDWDILFFGNGDGRDPYEYDKSNTDKIWYRMEYSRHGDSYILNPRSVIKIANYIFNDDSTLGFAYAPDHELNVYIQQLHLKAYWLMPPLVVQGSKNGTYADSITARG